MSAQDDLRRFPVRKRTTTKEKERQRALELQERQEALERARKKANRNTKKSANKREKRRDQIVEEITERLYCVCRKPNDPGRVMIGCDGGCEDWFHADCMGLSAQEANRLEKFICPDCRNRNRKRDSAGKRGRRDRPKKIKTNQYGFTLELSDSTESSDSENPYFTSDDESLMEDAKVKTDTTDSNFDSHVNAMVDEKKANEPVEQLGGVDTANPPPHPGEVQKMEVDGEGADAPTQVKKEPVEPESAPPQPIAEPPSVENLKVDFAAFEEEIAKLSEEDLKAPAMAEDDDQREELYALHMRLRLEELEIKMAEIETEIRVYNSGLQIAYLKTLEMQELPMHERPTVGESYITWGLPEEDREVAWRDTIVCPSCGGHIPVASFETHLHHCAIQQTMDALRDPKSVVNDRVQQQLPDLNSPLRYNRKLLVCGYPLHRGEGPPFKRQHFCMSRRHLCADHIGWDTTWLLEIIRKRYINDRRHQLIAREIEAYTQRSRMREEMMQAQLQAQQPMPGKPPGPVGVAGLQNMEDPSINIAQAYMQGMVPDMSSQYMMPTKMEPNEAMVHQPQTQAQADVALQAATAQFHMHSGNVIPVMPNMPPGMMNIDLAQIPSMPPSFGALNQQQMNALFQQISPAYYVDPAQLHHQQMAHQSPQHAQLAHLHHQQQQHHQQHSHHHQQPMEHTHPRQQRNTQAQHQVMHSQSQGTPDHPSQHHHTQPPPPAQAPPPQGTESSGLSRGTSFSFPEFDKPNATPNAASSPHGQPTANPDGTTPMNS